MYTDLITAYLPDASTIPQAQLLDTRQRWSNFLQPAWPDVDMRPNSVFGDLLLSPSAFQWGSAETAMFRFMSDLDLSNVAAGTIYNCPFTTKFLANFAITDAVYVQSTGVVRLSFATDEARSLDRSLQFQFGTDTFQIRLINPGPMLILPTGSTPPVGANAAVLFQAGDSAYIVDIPLVGAMSTAILAGNTGTTSDAVANLNSVIVLSDFNAGTAPNSLPTLAKLTRSTFYSATPNTRSGTTMFMRRQFPDLAGVSVTISGDVEMVRDMTGVLGFSDGRADVYAVSEFEFTDSQTVRLDYDPVLKIFIGALRLPDIPSQIKSVVPTLAPTILPTVAGGNLRIYSQSLQPARVPGCQAAYSPQEALWMVIDMPLTDQGAFLIPTLTDSNGTQYSTFVVTYTADPLLPTVAAMIAAPDNQPLGVDVAVRGFVPMIITSLEISYVRAAGTAVNLTQARSEIAQYLNTLLYPEIYSDARIFDSMFYAGAKDVRGISCRGGVQWSVANLILPASAPNPIADYVAATAAALRPRAISLTTSQNLTVQYRDLGIAGPKPTFESIGARNIRYIIDPANISFREVV